MNRWRPIKRAVVPALVAIASCLFFGHVSSQTIYKWIDENGVVNYGTSVPAGAKNVEQVTVTSTPATATPELPQTPSSTGAGLPASVEPSSELAAEPTPKLTAEPAEPTQPGEMTLEQLDQLCEAAREEAIAPLRDAAIKECKATPRTDPAYCERFYATFGDAVGIRPGVVRPRMFDDLPACVSAFEERRRRSR